MNRTLLPAFDRARHVARRTLHHRPAAAAALPGNRWREGWVNLTHPSRQACSRTSAIVLDTRLATARILVSLTRLRETAVRAFRANSSAFAISCRFLLTLSFVMPGPLGS